MRSLDASNSSALSAAISAFPGVPFAVIDGGLFDDLPALFRRERLFARSLYLDRANDEVQKAGPWLVALNQSPEATAFVLGLPATRPFAVYWSCAAGEAVLYRHLRSLNMARIPEWAAFQMPHPPGVPQNAEISQAVFFRHYDPRVLTALMPCLDTAQFSRVIGPAEEIAYFTPTHGVQRIIADREWPVAPPGLLAINSAQYEMMVERLDDTSLRRLAAYLRKFAPRHVGHLDDDTLIADVGRYRAEAERFGVRNENAIGMWSYIQVTSRVNLTHDEPVNRFMTDPSCGVDANERMEALFELRTRLLRKVYG